MPLFNATHNTKKCSKSNAIANNNDIMIPNVPNVQGTQIPNPFYSPPGFFLLYPGMFNQPYNNFTNTLPQTQQTNISIPPPSIHEFFEDLKKTYSECNFDEVKSKFLQEEIDVLDILSLRDCDWQDLGIKLGIKTKITRAVEKYR